MSGSEYLTIGDLEDYQWRLENREPASSLPMGPRRLSIPAAVELSCLLESSQESTIDSHFASEFSECSTWRLLQKLRWPQCGPSHKVFSEAPGRRRRKTPDSPLVRTFAEYAKGPYLIQRAAAVTPSPRIFMISVRLPEFPNKRCWLPSDVVIPPRWLS